MEEALVQDYWTTLGTNRDIIYRILGLLNLEAFVQVLSVVTRQWVLILTLF